MKRYTCISRHTLVREGFKKSDIYHFIGGVSEGNYHFLQAPLWSLANIKCDAANITRGAAIILHGMIRICSNMHDILHLQFFEIFLSVFGIFKGKNNFFPKVLKKLSSCQKNGCHFLGGEPKVINITFFNPSLRDSILVKGRDKI